MTKKKHLLLAMTNPVPGREDAYNDWYENTAYPTYKSLPGLVPLGRFRQVDVPQMFSFEMDNQFEYLSLYYFEAEDPVAFMDAIKDSFTRRPEYSFSDDIDQRRFCEPIFVALDEVNFEPLDRFESLKRD